MEEKIEVFGGGIEDPRKTQSKKMTDAEWASIVSVAIKDPERMALYNKLSALNEKFETQDVSFMDCDEWARLKEALLKREWQILVDSGKK